jgi:hypothetical protein
MYKAVLGLRFKRQEQLPAVTDWVAGVGVPAPGSRAVTLAIAIIFVPEQIAILPNAMDYANRWKSAVDLYRAIATIK